MKQEDKETMRQGDTETMEPEHKQIVKHRTKRILACFLSPCLLVSLSPCLATAPGLIQPCTARAADPAPKPAAKKDEVVVVMDDKTREAVARALKWLAEQQRPDGSWGFGGQGTLHNPAITSFALLAFMTNGNLPGQGQYGREVEKGARSLIRMQQQGGRTDGYFGQSMYNHGMATLALAELWGMTEDSELKDEIKPALKKAVELIVGCQCRQPGRVGGWRYQPDPNDADISVTIMQVMALRAAKNAGIHVPDETLERAIKYVMACYSPREGGFAYSAGSGGAGFARTAAGVCVLQLTMKYERKETDRKDVDPRKIEEKEKKDAMIKAGAKFLQSRPASDGFYWYGHYYAAHAMHQIGGDDWKQWYEQDRKTLLPVQDVRDGSWSVAQWGSEAGPVYNTAIAVIILSAPQDYLPIFQR